MQFTSNVNGIRSFQEQTPTRAPSILPAVVPSLLTWCPWNLTSRWQTSRRLMLGPCKCLTRVNVSPWFLFFQKQVWQKKLWPTLTGQALNLTHHLTLKSRCPSLRLSQLTIWKSLSSTLDWLICSMEKRPILQARITTCFICKSLSKNFQC